MIQALWARWPSEFQHMGVAGVALLMVAMVAVYLCVKYFVYLAWIGAVFRRRVAAGALSGEANDAPPSNPLLRIYAEATRHARSPRDLHAELAFLFHRHFHKVNRAMTLLRLISVISPLLGLMGTVLGIVKVFRVIGSQTVVNPALLATGIWEALTTTIMGLTITIPVLCFYYYFRMQIHGFQIEMTEYAGEALAARNS